MPRKHDHTGRSKGVDRYVGLPFYMLQSQAWRSLSPAARTVLIEAMAFYRGDNNGYIALPLREISKRAGCSPDTVSKSITDLDDKGFLERTFAGTFKRNDKRASEYRITLYRCDRTQERASKAFMHWRGEAKPRNSRGSWKRRSTLSDGTVRSEVQAKQSCSLRSDNKDRKTEIDPEVGPITSAQISYHVGDDQ